ncbi:MAG TPA: VanZ family protein [Terriglobales bacterium]|nr:VanZ family protein [Terriglobales bacterium]
MLYRKSMWRAWLPTLLWLMVIAIESTPAFSSAHTALWIRPLVALFGPDALHYLLYINAVLRKTGHFIGYGTLSWLAYRGWRETLAIHEELQYERRHRQSLPGWFAQALRSGWNHRAAALAVLSTIAVAALDEWHQSFFPSRTGVVHDVILDSFGGIFAQSLVMFIALTFARPAAPRSAREEVGQT